jgi:hypothetical protein
MAPRPEDLLADVVALEDPVDRFRALTELDAAAREFPVALRAARAEAIAELRRSGRSWDEIGALLGISKARAWQLGADPGSDDDEKETHPT